MRPQTRTSCRRGLHLGKPGVALLAAVVCACSGTGEARIAQVDGVLVLIEPGVNRSAMMAGVSGVVRSDGDGCWSLRDSASAAPVTVVWPQGTRKKDGLADSLQLPSGSVVTSGDEIQAGGGWFEQVTRSSIRADPDVGCLTGAVVSYVVISAGSTVVAVRHS